MGSPGWGWVGPEPRRNRTGVSSQRCDAVCCGSCALIVVRAGLLVPQVREAILSHKLHSRQGDDASRRFFELNQGDFQGQLLRTARLAIMSERSGLDRERLAGVDILSHGSAEHGSQHVPEEMFLHVDTSLYTRLGTYKDEALEKMYLADASSQNLSSERTQQTVIRLGVHVLFFIPLLFTAFLRRNDLGHLAAHGSVSNSKTNHYLTANVYIALSAGIVLVADVLILVCRKEIETLSAQMKLTQGSSVLFQLPSLLLVYLSVGCEVLNARRLGLTMFMVGVLEVQSPYVLSSQLPVRSLNSPSSGISLRRTMTPLTVVQGEG